MSNVSYCPFIKNPKVEYLLNSTYESIAYLPVTLELDKLMLGRNTSGYDYPEEFFSYNIYQRHNGVLFIKRCTDAIAVENLDPERERSFFEKVKGDGESHIQETENKIQNKRRLIEEAKLRIEENNYN